MSSDMRDYHLKEIAKHRDAAREILERADHEGRKPNDDEKSSVDAHVERVSEHESEITRIDERDAAMAMLETLGSVSEVATQEPQRIAARTPGEAFTRSPEYLAIREAAKSAGFPEFRISGVEMLAAVGDPVLEGTSTNQQAIVPQWQNFVTAPGLIPYPTVIQDVLNIVNLSDGNTAYWPKVTTRAITDLTDTAEAENKSGTEFVFAQATAQLLKWTAFASVSEELFQDADILTNYVNTQLATMALQKEERAIAQALYTASTTASTGYTIQASPNGFDKVLEAATMIRVAGGNPDFCLVNPYDWAEFVASRWTNGGYYSGSPFDTPSAGAVWGTMRFVQTPVSPRGTPLVGDSRSCILFRKGGLRIEASNSHGDFFRQNLVAIRSEIRSRLGVLYPEHLVEVNFGS